MLADVMREISNDATEKDQTVQKALKMVITKIEEAAKQGKRKVVYIISWNAFKDDKEYSARYSEVRDAVQRELAKEGFKVVRGREIGEGMSNWNTPYVVW